MTYLLVVLAFCAYARVLFAKKQQEQDFLFFHLNATVFVAVFEWTLVALFDTLLRCRAVALLLLLLLLE